MSGPTCTYRFTGQPECGQPATVRQGHRCPNGCSGEGGFDYACADHAPHVETVAQLGHWCCLRCNARVESFPVQRLDGAVVR